MTDHNDLENPNRNQDYEVGYCRPPKGTRFKAGQSGNPKGRKRQPKSVQAQMQTVLSKKVSINDGGKPKRLPLQEVILRNLANKAAKGDLKAAAFVFNLLTCTGHAEDVAIDQSSLSAEDQVLLDQMISQLMGADDPDLSAPSGSIDVGYAEAELSSETDQSQQNNSIDEDNAHDDPTET